MTKKKTTKTETKGTAKSWDAFLKKGSLRELKAGEFTRQTDLVFFEGAWVEIGLEAHYEDEGSFGSKILRKA